MGGLGAWLGQGWDQWVTGGLNEKNGVRGMNRFMCTPCVPQIDRLA